MTTAVDRDASHIGQRIGSSYGSLSPQEQRVADFILDHLADLAVYNATELAQLSGVSKATVSRLFRRLGFESATEVRDQVRAERRAGTPLSGRTDSVGFAEQIDAELANIRQVFERLGDGRLVRIAGILAGARRVLVIGYRNSYPVALHLRQQLSQARDGVLLAPLPGQSMGEELSGFTAQDAIVLIGFRRRPAGFGRLLAAADASGATVILIADPGARRYADRVDEYLEVPIDAPGAFDSYASAMSLVGVLAGAVLGEKLRAGRTRIASISGLYEQLGEVEA